MTAQQWVTGRRNKALTQVSAARMLGVTQPYLSQLETGRRAAGSELAQRAARLYELTPALPLPDPEQAAQVDPDRLQEDLAALGYPKFAHVAGKGARNPAGVVFGAVVQQDLDTRLVEALPWVLSAFVDLNWPWLRDHAKLWNAQNRLGYMVHLAKEAAHSREDEGRRVQVLSSWERELEEARLAREDTLCRASMSPKERVWLRVNRPEAAAHWNLLTALSAEQLPYVQRSPR